MYESEEETPSAMELMKQISDSINDLYEEYNDLNKSKSYGSITEEEYKEAKSQIMAQRKEWIEILDIIQAKLDAADRLRRNRP